MTTQQDFLRDAAAAVAQLKQGLGNNWSPVTALQFMLGRRGEFAADCAAPQEQTLLYLAHLVAKRVCSDERSWRCTDVSYKTAWLMKHKLLQTMLLREEPRRLDGRVEIDDAYLGGEKAGKPGRGSENKTAFVAAVQTSPDGKPLFMRLTRMAGFTKEALGHWAEKSLTPQAHVVSDGLWCFEAVTQTAANHERHVVGHGRQAVQRPEFRWVNTMLGNLKTSLNGTYHAIKHAKYADRYLAEFAYRFNRRFDLAAMVPRLLRAAVTTRPHPLSVLRVSEAGS